MKKSTLILILVVYVASIVIINFFGMSVKVYDEEVAVSSVTCTNEDDPDNGVSITEGSSGTKTIVVDFVAPAFDIDENNEPIKDDEGNVIFKDGGTTLFLEVDVKPNNAWKKQVDYVYDQDNKNVCFHTDGTGRKTGMVLFYAPTMFYCTIESTDGRFIRTTVLIWVKAPANN